MNKYQKAIEVVDTLLHLMCGEEREDGYKPTMEEMSNSMNLLKDLANKADSKHEEITASEMFKKLGYRCIKSDRSIWYINDSDVENYGSIEFWFCDCTFEATGNYGDPLMVNVKELEAINKQCEELGWI